MGSTQTESGTEAEALSETRREIEDLKKTMEAHIAAQANVDATAGTTDGPQAIQAAAHPATWSTLVAGGVGLVAGLSIAFVFIVTTRS